MSILSTAVLLLCAWSQPHCVALQQHPPVIANTTVTMGSAIFIANAATYWQGNRAVKIAVSDKLQHPVAIAAVLAHEAQEIQEGSPPNGKDCGGYDGWASQDAFLTWFSATFGPPSVPVGSPDWAIFMDIGQHPSWPC